MFDPEWLFVVQLDWNQKNSPETLQNDVAISNMSTL